MPGGVARDANGNTPGHAFGIHGLYGHDTKERPGWRPSAGRSGTGPTLLFGEDAHVSGGDTDGVADAEAQLPVTVAGDFGFQGVAGIFAQKLQTDGRTGGSDVAYFGQDDAVSGLRLQRNFQLIRAHIRDRGFRALRSSMEEVDVAEELIDKCAGGVVIDFGRSSLW